MTSIESLLQLRTYVHDLATFWYARGKRRNAKRCKDIESAIDELLTLREAAAIEAMERDEPVESERAA